MLMGSYRKLTFGVFIKAWVLCAFIASLGVGAGFAWAAGAAQTAGITISARGGFDSYFKESQWMPVRVTVANDGPDVSGNLELSVPGNASEKLFTRPVDLPTRSRREIVFYVPPEGYVTSLKVDFVSGNKILASADVHLAQAGPQDVVYGVLAASPSAYNSLTNVRPINGNANIAQLEPADLPALAASWKTLDALVIADTDTGALSPDQRQAMADWVRQGGRLIVVGGPGWQKTAAGLGGLLPLAPAGTRTIADLGPLANLAGAAPPAGQAIAAEGTLAPDAVSLGAADGLTLAAYRQEGFGQVAFIAVDPALDPLKGWDGLSGLFRAILARSTSRPDWANGMVNWSSGEQAAKAVPGLTVPSPWEICGFLAVYIVMVGPLNYFLLRRLKRRSWAWITIPAVVLVFSVGVYVTGYELRGNQAVLHRLAVVQVWPNAEHAQVDELVGLFSPRRTTYALTFDPGVVAQPLPYTSFAPNITRQVIEQTDRTRLPQIHAEIGAINVFAAQAQVPAPRFAASLAQHLDGSLAGGSATLDGTVTNQSDLTLTDVVLLAPGGAQRLGTLLPGQTATLAPLVLSNARAAPAGGATGVLPVQVGVPMGKALAMPSTPDSTFSDILGVNPAGNAEEYRRNMLLSTVLNQYSGGGRGNGIYLAGWSTTTPLNTSLSTPYLTKDLSLYLIELPCAFDWGQGALTIPPGGMTWALLSGDQDSYQPYETTFDPGGQATFQFAPYRPLPYTSVRQLALRLDNYGATGAVTQFKVELYDFAEATWAEMPALTWGSNHITAPARFVDAEGDILVRVTDVSGTKESLQQLDFTLDVDR